MALDYQQKADFQHYENIAGLDEAGRGPWAGPVVAAAVILPRGYQHPEIDDSKKLSPVKRERLFDIIMHDALAVGVGIVAAEDIDRMNILRATKLAMVEALAKLKVRPQLLLIDALHLEMVTIPQVAIIHGDALALPIAAASIIATVTRDRLMMELHQRYPHYGFDQHKGYGTKLHQERLQLHGPVASVHRMSYRPIKQLKMTK